MTLGRYLPWGSECTDCGNATCGSMICDSCKSDEHTVALYRLAPNGSTENPNAGSRAVI